MIFAPANAQLRECVRYEIGGLPLLRRMLLTAKAEGLVDITLVCEGEEMPWLRDIATGLARVLPPGALAAACGKRLFLHTAFLPAPGFLGEAAAAPVGTAFDLAKKRVGLMLGGAAMPAGAHAWQREGARRQQPARGWLITSEQERREAENALLAGLGKASDGILARLINRRVSQAVTRRLMHTAITPNQMTLISMFIGLAAAALFLLPQDAAGVAAATLFLLHSILDGCDGELARLKFMQTRLGGFLDFWADNVVHMAVFLCLGIGLAQSQQAPSLMLLGAIAAAATLLAAAIVQRHAMVAGAYVSVSSRTEKTSLVRIADALSRRDFIYLVLLLAVVGHLDIFLWLAAIGTPLYVLVLAAIGLKDRAHA